jgi:hypothetical protein
VAAVPSVPSWTPPPTSEIFNLIQVQPQGFSRNTSPWTVRVPVEIHTKHRQEASAESCRHNKLLGHYVNRNVEILFSKVLFGDF